MMLVFFIRLLTLFSTLILTGGMVACTPFLDKPHEETLAYISIRKRSQSDSHWEKLASPFSRLLNTQHSYSFYRNTQEENFWVHLQEDFHLLHHTDKPAVKAQIYWFMSSPYHLTRTIQRSGPYIRYIYEQVKRRNLPAELVLLPLVESTYNPLAVNRSSGASGLWQLTAETARGFGIRQDWLFDGRRDIYASTHAALDYLTYLNQFFSGNWLLTLAAYDTGEGNVQRAIRYNARRNLSISFWSLPLALETRSYVPRLLALSAIIKNPRKYGLVLPNIDPKLRLGQANVNAGISILHAAELANISLSELKQLNPGFKQIAFVPNRPYKLLLPIECIKSFNIKLSKLPPEAFYVDFFNYKIKPGDNLITIAKKHGVTVHNLRLWNGLQHSSIVRANKTLIIKLPPSSHQPFKIHSLKKKSSSRIKRYQVRSGDNLSIISKKLNIKVAHLKQWNQLTKDTLQPGQYLKLQPIP